MLELRTLLYDPEGMKGVEFLKKLKRVAKRRGLSLLVVAHGKGSHQRVYLGKAFTTIKYLQADLHAGLLHGMCKDLGITVEELNGKD